MYIGVHVQYSHKFAICKRSINGLKSVISAKLPDYSRPQLHLSLLGAIALMGTWRHLAARVETFKGWGKQWQTTPKNFPRMLRARAIPVAWLGSGSCQNRPKCWILMMIIMYSTIYYYPILNTLLFFRHITQIPNFMKFRSVVVELLYADRRTDMTKSCFAILRESLKISTCWTIVTFVYISLLHGTSVGAREGSYNTTFTSWAYVRRSNERLEKINEKSDDLYSSPNNIRIIKSKTINSKVNGTYWGEMRGELW
jgi:hypothetical protein